MGTQVKRGGAVSTRRVRRLISVGLRLEEDEHAALQTMADAEHRSLNQQVRHLIRRADDERKAAA